MRDRAVRSVCFAGAAGKRLPVLRNGCPMPYTSQEIFSGSRGDLESILVGEAVFNKTSSAHLARVPRAVDEARVVGAHRLPVRARQAAEQGDEGHGGGPHPRGRAEGVDGAERPF